MPDDRISLRQLLTLTFAALLSPAIQLLPGSTARRAGEAGWLATLVALPVLLGLEIMGRIRRLPGARYEAV